MLESFHFLRPEWLVALVPTALLYLASYTLVPDTAEGHSRQHDKTNFRLPGPAFFGCLAVHFALFAVYRIADVAQGGRAGQDGQYPVTMLVLVALAVVGFRLKTPRSYVIHLALWLAALVMIAALRVNDIR